MTPDLPFYLPVTFPSATHTALAVVTTDLVLSFAAWAIWHGLLAEPALAAAPTSLRSRMPGLPPGLGVRLASPARVGWTLLALVVGAGTHVLWDEFTHPRRWGPEHIPALAENWGTLPGYRWLQYATSLIGGVVLLGWLLLWWRRTAWRSLPDRPASRWPWALVAAAGAVAGVPAALSAPSIGAAVFTGTTWGGGAALVVALVLALAWHAARAGTRPD
jgi:hypothetical protein